MEQVVIEHNDGTYLLRIASSKPYHAQTLVELLQKEIEIFSEQGSAETTNKADIKTLSTVTSELVALLHSYNLRPSQITSILHRLQNDIQRSLYDIRCKSPKRLQTSLQDMFACAPMPYPFAESEPFNTNKLYPERYGSIYLWDFNGRFCVKKKGIRQELFISKQEAKHLKLLSREDLEQCIESLSQAKRAILFEFVETLKDIDIGAYPMVNNRTRPMDDTGDLNHVVMEQGLEAEIEEE